MPSMRQPLQAEDRAPRLAGTKAPMSSVYTGSRAEQLMSGTTMMVANRSFGFSIVRVAMMPGTAQA